MLGLIVGIISGWIVGVLMLKIGDGMMLDIETKRLNKHYDKLMQQEQMDRIEHEIERINSPVRKQHEVSSHTKEMKGYMNCGIDETNAMTFLADRRYRVNQFNNQFIVQNIEGVQKMQCVACGSYKVTVQRDEDSFDTFYQCDTCSNTYKLKE